MCTVQQLIVPVDADGSQPYSGTTQYYYCVLLLNPWPVLSGRHNRVHSLAGLSTGHSNLDIGVLESGPRTERTAHFCPSASGAYYVETEWCDRLC